MESILLLLVILFLITSPFRAVFYWVTIKRLQKREKDMRDLANDFKLEFIGNKKHAFRNLFLILLFLWKPERKLNAIRGSINRRNIYIYDYLWPYFPSRGLRYTVIEIDGTVCNGHYENVEISSTYLTPINTLRDILTRLQAK